MQSAHMMLWQLFAWLTIRVIKFNVSVKKWLGKQNFLAIDCFEISKLVFPFHPDWNIFFEPQNEKRMYLVWKTLVSSTLKATKWASSGKYFDSRTRYKLWLQNKDWICCRQVGPRLLRTIFRIGKYYCDYCLLYNRRGSHICHGNVKRIKGLRV